MQDLVIAALVVLVGFQLYALLWSGGSSSVDVPVGDSGSPLDAVYANTIGVAMSGISAQTVSQQCAVMTATFEGCDLTAYPDAGTYSIGYGHKPASGGQTCSQQQANDWLYADLNSAATVVLSHCLPTTVLSQAQLDALSDWVYNCGAGKVASSQIWGEMNNNDWASVCSTLLLWCHSQGQYVDALYQRRLAEANLIQQGVYP